MAMTRSSLYIALVVGLLLGVAVLTADFAGASMLRGESLIQTNAGTCAEQGFHYRLIDVPGRVALCLTGTPHLRQRPAWSPDGRRLAYYTVTIANQARSQYLHVLDVYTRQERVLARADNHYVTEPPVWTADGSGLLVVLFDGFSGTNLYRFDLTSGHLTRIANRVSAVRISPDGETYAYVGPVDSGSFVFLASADAPQITEPVQPGQAPVWSPDGRWLAFFHSKDNQFSLAVLDMMTRTVFEQPIDTPNTLDMTWSPDSRTLLFAGGREDNLHALDIATRTVTTVDPSPANAVLPVWSPGGTWVAYANRRRLPDRTIISIEVLPAYNLPAAGRSRTLTAPDGMNTSPVWWPPPAEHTR